MDEEFTIAFANSACGVVGAEGKAARWGKLKTLIPHPQELQAVETILEDVFFSRKPQVAETTVHIQDRLIWGRIHFRSIRMGKERFILVLVVAVGLGIY